MHKEDILKALDGKLLKKQDNFPEKYYSELFRLNKWKYNKEEVRSKSVIILEWTKFLIYDRLNDFNEFDYELWFHIGEIITIFKLSKTMEQAYKKLKKIEKDNLKENPFKFDEKGCTIEHIEANLSKFDELMLQALNYNPNKDNKKKNK